MSLQAGAKRWAYVQAGFNFSTPPQTLSTSSASRPLYSPGLCPDRVFSGATTRNRTRSDLPA
jgi:hypothetical protein